MVLLQPVANRSRVSWFCIAAAAAPYDLPAAAKSIALFSTAARSLLILSNEHTRSVSYCFMFKSMFYLDSDLITIILSEDSVVGYFFAAAGDEWRLRGQPQTAMHSADEVTVKNQRL